MEKQTKTYYVVEIGGADLYFADIQKASDFFAKVVGSGAVDMGSVGYNKDYAYVRGTPTVSMKTEVVGLYQTEKAARFAVSEKEKEKEE